MKITIVGPGAMGCLISGFLSKLNENEIWLLDKTPKRVKYFRTHGIKITGLSKIIIPPEKIKITLKSKEIGKSDLIIIFVKSHHTRTAIKSVLSCIGCDTLILTLQNGLNNIETIKKVLKSKKFDIDNIIGGITSLGATLIKTGIVRHAGKGETLISGIDKNFTGKKKKNILNVVNNFNRAGIKTKLAKNIDTVIWSKLILNSAINPVSVITGLRNGEIIKNVYYRELLFSIAKESFNLARKNGINLLYFNPERKILEVCKKTSKNINSMLQDIINKKKTEIDSINGAIINEAKKKNIDVPCNRTMWLLVKGMTNG